MTAWKTLTWTPGWLKAAQGAYLICIFVALHFSWFSTLKYKSWVISLPRSEVTELAERRILQGRACPDVALRSFPSPLFSIIPACLAEQAVDSCALDQQEWLNNLFTDIWILYYSSILCGVEAICGVNVRLTHHYFNNWFWQWSLFVLAVIINVSQKIQSGREGCSVLYLSGCS